MLAAGVSAVHTSGVNRVIIPIQLSASQLFTNAGPGVLNFSHDLIFDLNGHNATFGLPTGEIQMSDTVIGAGTVIKTGSGVLTWGNIGTYSATTEIKEGHLVLPHVNALGASSGGTIVFPAGTLRIDGGLLSMTYAEPLTLEGKLLSGGFFVGTNSHTWSGPILLNGTESAFEISGKPMTINGVVSGAGSLKKFGLGTLTLNANNTYTGGTSNLSGGLLINGSQPQSPVALYSGTLGGSGTAGSVSAIESVAKMLDPGSTGPGRLTCGDVALNNSTTFAAQLNGATPGTSYDQLRVIGNVVLGNAALNVSLGFVPAVGQSFTILDNDGADAIGGTFNGLPQGTIFSVGTNQFSITYFGGTGNDIVLTRVNLLSTGVMRIWTGAGANNFWTTAANWSNNVAAGPGDDLVFPAGAARLINSNNFPTGTIFNSITFSGGNYFLYGSNILLNAGINATNTTTVNSVLLPITLNANQKFVSGNPGVNLSLFSDINTDGKLLTFAGKGSSHVTGVISGGGGLIKTDSGYALLYGSNTFSGPVEVTQGDLWVYHGNALGSINGNTTVYEGAGLTFLNSLVVPEPLVVAGSLANGGLSITLNGPITLAGPNVTLFAPLIINGVISGSEGFTKLGFNAVVLNATNTYNGTTTVSQGSVQVNGFQPGSPIVLVDGTISGTGRAGTITVTGLGLINPGSSGPGILSSSNLVFNFSTYLNLELDGTSPGTGHDQLNVAGTVSLANANLNVVLGFTPSPGTAFTIINNDGVDAVMGIFNDSPEGTVLTNSGTAFRISYVGGDGNDVVLTRVSQAIGFGSILRLANGHIQLQGTGGVSGFSYTIEAAANLNPAIQWSNIGSAVANPSGQFFFTDTNAAFSAIRFYRARTP